MVLLSSSSPIARDISITTLATYLRNSGENFWVCFDMTGGFIFLTQVSGHGDYTSHLLPAMVILGIGIGLSFVAIRSRLPTASLRAPPGSRRACSTRPRRSAER
jgi:hypothetical protein